ncbi:maleylpyruvate isomerase N-terminal domain-containing protein [Streptomyces sp. NPDC058001]|uniref:maleylpyruvate isomerase N-terminal domain-containing protein n=1 Tax=Streptomyces sp. NPDC058001 TaxID=3346300 RepID=UPI0036E753F2
MSDSGRFETYGGGGDDGEDPDGGASGGARPGPRIPTPRTSVEDSGRPLPDLPAASDDTPPDRPARDRTGPDRPAPERPVSERPVSEQAAPAAPAPSDPQGPPPPLLPHRVLKSLLGAWALAACSAPEAAAVEEHLGCCGSCAEEALRLRDAVALLHPAETLDLDPGLRTRVLEDCLDRRPPRIPVPDWAAAYDAETARLDALLQDIADSEWHAPVRLRWYEGEAPVARKTTVAGVIAHLLAVDGLVATALGLDDPLRAAAPGEGPGAKEGLGPADRTEAYWRGAGPPPTRAVRTPWREQSHSLVRTVAFAAGGATAKVPGSGQLPVSYGDFTLPLRDAMLDRAFECWIHATDIADAVAYPYGPPAPRHLHRMIDLAARMLPETLAARRRAGLASPARGLAEAGRPGRSLRLEIEGVGGGDWFIPLDSPAALGSAAHEVAHIALDGVEFCRLAAGHVPPKDAAAGQTGDREAIRDVLSAAASLSRL